MAAPELVGPADHELLGRVLHYGRQGVDYQAPGIAANQSLCEFAGQTWAIVVANSRADLLRRPACPCSYCDDFRP